MGHNQLSWGVFRFGSLRTCWAAGISAVVCISMSYATQKTPSYNTLPPTKTGIDVWEQEQFAALRGKRVALVTNQTGIDSRGRRTVEVLAHAPGVKLVALLSPEHGLAGTVDRLVANSTDAETGLPVYSLYGETRRPTPEMLKNIDALG